MNLLPYSMYKKLGLGELKPTSITLSLADRPIKIPKGTIEDVLIQVDRFYYLVALSYLTQSRLHWEPIMCPSYWEGHSWLLRML